MRNEGITPNLNTMICQMVQIDVTNKNGRLFRASKNSPLDPASMIYKLIKHPGLVSSDGSFSNAIDFMNCSEKPSAPESIENYIDPSTVIASKIFCDESFFCPHVKRSNLTLDFASDESQCCEFMEKTLIPRGLSKEKNLGLASKNEEETLNVIAINKISLEKCINVVNEPRETNDRIEIPENNHRSSVNLARLSETDVPTPIVEIKNKTASKSDSTQTERSLIIRTTRSCPSHGKRVRLNFLMKINRRLKFQDTLFIYRKSSDHLIMEKGKASRSPAYVPIFERFRWKYLTPRK